MRIALPELDMPGPLTLVYEHAFSTVDFRAFSDANPDLRIERTAMGEIVIVPPAGGESDYRTMEVAGELRAWAKRDGRGKAFGSSVGFVLPDSSIFSPDAAWVSNDRLATLSRDQRRDFLAIAPEFVVEVMSPSDRLAAAKKKMQAWLANGVELGWLIDGESKSVYVFRPNAEPQCLTGIDSISGEGPIEGFTLDLRELWAGL